MTREEKIKFFQEKLREKKYGISKNMVKWGAVATLLFSSSGANIIQKLSAAENNGKKEALENIKYNIEQEKLKQSLLNNQDLFDQFCKMRSSDLADSLLTKAQNIQTEIKSKGRQILQQRWGKNSGGQVNLKFYCIRSGLELLKEAAEVTGNKEFYEGFVKSIEDVNPNSCFSAMQVYNKNPEYIFCNNLGQRLKEESKNNPDDVFMVIHKSSGNTSSGYHFVLVANNKVISFNREQIKDISDYFQSSSQKGMNKGYMMNITKEVEKNSLQFQKQAYETCIDEYIKMPQEEKDALFTDYIMNNTNNIAKTVSPVLSFSKHNVINLIPQIKQLSPEKKKIFTAMVMVDNLHKNKLTFARAEMNKLYNHYNSRS